MRVEASMKMMVRGRRYSRLRTLAWLAVLLGFLPLNLAEAQIAPGTMCEDFQGRPCTINTDCPQSGQTKMVCVGDGVTANTCQPSCDRSGAPDLAMCTMGEGCRPGTSPGLGTHHYCVPSIFKMDLNLLDSCIYHFIERIQPDTSTANACSVARNLEMMLERDGVSGFNIYDVDLCVKSYLQDTGCSVATSSCPNNQTFCNVPVNATSAQQDAACGRGLFCNLDTHRCERECGLIVDRADRDATTIERACTGSMAVCDYTRGRCNSLLDNADTCTVHSECGQDRSCIAGVCQPGGLPPELTCSINQDCPNGAYCFLGQCTPKCYRNIDCLDSNWYCSSNNTCLPKPKAGTTQPAFNPQDYNLTFGFSQVNLDPLNDRAQVPVVIMNTRTRNEVFGQPGMVFGYRLELTYARKQEAKCQNDLTTMSPADQADCLISDSEEFITLDNPFGTLYGTGDGSLGVRINTGIAAKLSPGVYQATLKALYSNGTSASTILRFVKPSPSGDYSGRLTVLSGSYDAANKPIALASSNVVLQLFVDKNAPKVQWDTLLQQNNVHLEKEIEDITSGFPITGYLKANESVMFANPNAMNEQQNLIPIKGIYADHLGRMRLITAIDIDANHCRSENGLCTPGNTSEMQVSNAFGRKVRRIVEFIGPYNDATHDFRGAYRETLSGLAPFAVTLDGGFQLKQVTQNDTPISLPALLPAASTVAYPALTALQAAVQADVNAYCTTAEAATFGTTAPTAGAPIPFLDYMDRTFDATPLFGDLVTFKSTIEQALGSLTDPVKRGAALTLADYFQGQVKFCPPGSPPTCAGVDQRKLLCGLAGFRKAMLAGLVDMESSHQAVDAQGFQIAPVMFCPGIPGRSTECPTKAAQARDVVAVQEHNRFFRELVQTYVFEANNKLSEAFYAVFKAPSGRSGTPDAPQFLSQVFRETRLREALAKYNGARAELLSPTVSRLLFNLPAAGFKGEGTALLGQVHNVLYDRLDALTELIDSRRRVLTAPNAGNDFIFLKQVMHLEWLQQVYAATLQKHWQRGRFAYAGHAEKMMQKGEALLAKANSSRNPLGLHANRVYFENQDLRLNNWQYFRSRVDTKLTALRTQATTTAQLLRDALVSEGTLSSNLKLEINQVDAALAELCGSDTPLPTNCDLSVADKEIQTSCRGASCPFPYQCDGPECDQVASIFSAAISEPACRSDAQIYKVQVRDDQQRLCVRGRMGALMQERVSLELSRKQSLNKAQSLLRQIARQQAYIRETQQANSSLLDFIDKQSDKILAVELSLMTAETVFEQATQASSAFDCMVIVGLAAGTNCATKGIGVGMAIAASAIKATVRGGLSAAKAKLQETRELRLLESQQNAEVRAMRMNLDNMVTDVENIIAEYDNVTQQLFNLNIQITDTHFLAQEAARRYRENVATIFERLTGQESGNALLRNKLVQDFNAEFQKLLIEAYKMSQAFIHRFNLVSEAGAITNRVYQLNTLDDVSQFMAELTEFDQTYCGTHGGDCDAANNRQLFRFSVRQQLFPEIRDIVDPASGKVLTAGQQFHNIITSSSYLRRRTLASGTQIELPFAIWLQNRGTNGQAPQPYMLDPTECNHIIASDLSGAAGTIAVNIDGINLGSATTSEIRYRLARGDTDYMRSCHEFVSPTSEELKLNTLTAGWSPTSAQGSLSTPPAFETTSSSFVACEDVDLSNPATQQNFPQCFNYFARDRSLAAPDWKLIIPNVDTSQSWLLGSGVPLESKPVIEDIVMYFRFAGRQAQ